MLFFSKRLPFIINAVLGVLTVLFEKNEYPFNLIGIGYLLESVSQVITKQLIIS